MNDFDRQPGAIDDPGMKGGVEPDPRTLPPGSSADDTGGRGGRKRRSWICPDRMTRWPGPTSRPDTLVVGPDGEELVGWRPCSGPRPRASSTAWPSRRTRTAPRARSLPMPSRGSRLHG